ncbi:cobyrinic acid a,c-diamide synthase [Sorangium cellulosum]|uniref:Cobyrinate a,c-diamide synthase n=1 Tax=Sorangium cellulosum TaxID=56 RepID=A0A2L0EIK9_SORCE|nr:cobyrinate a,c-diamide synthase [Sorangium cellulosum]AUX39135.1 cobyrinic acid a,c-diamide synthase [Sorangium cellulosum]
MSRQIPRLVVAGVASGVGKTTVTVAIARALRARGLRVALFKCGPDYLDPTYHARAIAGASHNLDGWMMGRDAVLSTFAEESAGADVALLEGVMGLFDGASPAGEEGSTAEIAKWLEAPVVLVADASGMARSIAALVQGFATFDPGLRVAGVVCNQVGSRGHLDLLRQAQRSPPVLGGLPRDEAQRFPERHLGLRTADEAALPEERLDHWGARAEEWIGLDALLEIARGAPALPSPPPSPPPARAATVSGEPRVDPPGARPRAARIGVAFDEAFHFYYADNLRRLEAAGAELVRFSPLRDVRLPDVDALYLGGGYPEVHAERLAENAAMRAEIRAFAGGGGPIYAECGGLMVLAEAIRTLDGRAHPMVGLIPAEAVMCERLQALGYVEVETQARTILGQAGLRFRGHQFRYSELRPVSPASPAASAPASPSTPAPSPPAPAASPAPAPATSSPPLPIEHAYSVRRRRGGQVAREGYWTQSVLASYVHAHWASNPLVPEGLVASAAAYRKERAR